MLVTEKEKCAQGLLYDAGSDKEMEAERLRCKDLCFQFNNLLPSMEARQRELMKEILGKTGEHFTIIAPFFCDYGYNIQIGEHFFANHNCVILDGAKVTFGDKVFVAPNCCFSTAGHPIDFRQRDAGLEFAYPITVGSHVWIGANVTVLPGVSIGDNSVIGAGSVVTRDIPPNVVAAGNPCRVLRKIDE